MGTFSGVTVDVGQPNPLWVVPPQVGGPGLYKKVGEQASKQPYFIVSASFFPLGLALSVCPDFPS